MSNLATDCLLLIATVSKRWRTIARDCRKNWSTVVIGNEWRGIVGTDAYPCTPTKHENALVAYLKTLYGQGDNVRELKVHLSSWVSEQFIYNITNTFPFLERVDFNLRNPDRAWKAIAGKLTLRSIKIIPSLHVPQYTSVSQYRRLESLHVFLGMYDLQQMWTLQIARQLKHLSFAVNDFDLDKIVILLSHAQSLESLELINRYGLCNCIQAIRNILASHIPNLKLLTITGDSQREYAKLFTPGIVETVDGTFEAFTSLQVVIKASMD